MINKNEEKEAATAVKVMKETETETKAVKKAGYVGIVGLPNAGKSTLLNHLIGAKVSITSNKPQTTRKNILGILTENNSQCVFVDAPGFIQSPEGLNSYLEKQWRDVVDDVDLLVFVINLDAKREGFDKVLDLMDSISKDKIALITKTDLGHDEREIIIEGELSERKIEYFKSRRKGKSEELQISPEFKERILTSLPESGGFYYQDEEIYTPQTLRELSSEIILENVFRFLSAEVPYETGVIVNGFEEKPGRYVIHADICVSKDRYKKIVIGKKGETIKRIGTEARKSMEREFGNKIFLDLKVKEKEAWNKKKGGLKELGYA